MKILLADIGHALVALRRRPGAVVVPVLTMAVGIGASAAIFSALHVALFGPLPYADPSRLVSGRATFHGEVNPWVSAPDFYDYRRRTTVFEALSAYEPGARLVTVVGRDGAEAALATQVSWDLFTTLGVSPALGRHFDAAEGERGGAEVVVISHGYWQRAMGGAKDVLGRTLPLAGRTPIVVGVMPPGFRFAYATDIWIPLQRDSPGNTVRHFHRWMLLGRLKPWVTVARAQEQIDRVSAQLQKEYPDSNKDKALLVTPLQEVLAENDRPSLLVLMAAVGVLLLVACADVAGLLLSRGSARQEEMAIRSALGATRWHLARQLLAESALMAAAAGGLGLLLALWLRTLVLRFVPLAEFGVTRLPVGAPVLLFALGVTVVTAALFGIGPALFAGRGGASDALKGGTRMTEARGRALFRQGLVAVQVAMCAILLVMATLLGRSLLRLQAIDPGFATDRLLTAQIQLGGAAYQAPADRLRFFTGLMDDFRAVPGVQSATIVNNLPILNAANNIPVWDADHPPAQTSEAPLACARFVLPGYFRAMGIPLVAGRDVSANDEAGPGRPWVVVISRSAGRTLFRGVNPIGRRLGIFTGDQAPAVAEVVGVVGDVRMNSLGSDYSLAMYAPYQVAAPRVMHVAVRTSGRPLAVVRALQQSLARRDRSVLLTEVQTMDTVLATSLRGFSLRAGAVLLFGGAALLLAMLGVYGVLAFTVHRRRQEIGLRMVIGASRPGVVRWVLARALWPVAAGLGLGLTGALGVGRLVGDLLFDVEPTDPATFAGVTLCLALAALAACLVPAGRAIRVNPAVALRSE